MTCLLLQKSEQFLWSDSSALETASDQTKVRSKRPLIRLRWARNGLRSELARFSFVRFHARSFSFCSRSLFVRSLSRSSGLVTLILRSLAFRSFVFTLLRFFRSFCARSLIRIKCARIVLWSDWSALETASDQTQVRSKRPLIRLKCARNCLWSDLSALETASDQTQVRSKRPLIRLKCARNDLWSDSSALETASDQTQVRSKRPLIRLKCARNVLWSDLTQTMVQTKETMIRPSRPNWPLIRPNPDHGPD